MCEFNEVAEYERIEMWCQEAIHSGSDFLFDSKLFTRHLQATCDEFRFPFESLHSLLRNLHLTYVKITSHKIKRDLKLYLEEYKAGEAIKNLAKSANYPPYLFCRYLVEHIAILKNGRKSLTQAMRDPVGELGSREVISKEYLEAEENVQGDIYNGQTRLSFEVCEAVESDPMYGPMHDRSRHFVGVEYEVVLERTLSDMDIPFETESDLREKGSSRTPDILLTSPIGVKVGTEWKVVCWIDSKAMFGDVSTHNTAVLPQAESYVHRFGPGMILYWFGHAPLARLGDAKGDLVIQGWQMPDTFLWPTGEIGHRKEAKDLR